MGVYYEIDEDEDDREYEEWFKRRVLDIHEGCTDEGHDREFIRRLALWPEIT
jgi:hypothetical protein